MTKLRQLWLLTALASLAVLASGYFLAVSPQKSEAAKLQAETETQLAANRRLQSEIDMLNKQKKDLPKQQAKLAEFASLIPSNPSLPSLVRALTDAADAANVELTSISPVLPEFAEGVNTQTGAKSKSRIAGPNGTVLADISVTLKVVGHYSNVSMFFDEIEELKRALLVSDFTIKAAESERGAAEADEAAVDLDDLEAEIGAHVLMTTKAAPVAKPTTSSESNDDVTK